MKNNTLTKIILLLFIIIVIGIILYFVFETETKDEVKFKNEYENLNNQKNENGKKYVKVKIPMDNTIEYLTIDETLDFLDNKTGILYFGFPQCPWCRTAIPILIQAAKENETKIYYNNALSIRDEKKLSKGKIIITKKGTKKYYKLIKKLDKYLPEYEGLKDKSIKRLYFPTVVFVMGGKVVGIHVGTLDSQKNPYKPLDKKQENQLKKIYTKNIEKIYGVCDDKC